MVCSKATTKSLFSTLFFLGLYGALLIGLLSDKFGRKKTCYIFLIVSAIFNIFASLLFARDWFAPNVQQILFASVRFFCGIASNLFAVCTVLAIEFCGPNKRVLASTAIYYAYILSELVVVLCAYFIRNRYLYSVYTAIISSLILVLW